MTSRSINWPFVSSSRPSTQKASRYRTPATSMSNSFADGKPLLKVFLDRNIKVERTLDLTGVWELTVRVDNANGKSWWDWLIFSASAPA